MLIAQYAFILLSLSACFVDEVSQNKFLLRAVSVEKDQEGAWVGALNIGDFVSVQGRFGGIRVLGLTAVGLAFE
jgi:hypothetical protein